MNSPEDTIAAISTPVGQGGIGIVRMSGPESLTIADRIFISGRGRRPSGAGPWVMLYGHAADPSDGSLIDEVILSVMRAPHSYTREDVVEINCHGGMTSVRKILGVVISLGARLAEPGEFTKRAFLNGRISLAQAEAVSDLIAAVTDESRRIAAEQLRGGLSERLMALREPLLEECAFAEAHIDFPEEEVETGTREQICARLAGIGREIRKLADTFTEARFFREGLTVAIVGRPNVGKSSLLNALLKRDRAIVTEIPGTTRDLIEEYLNINGLPVRVTDTAGIRNSDETVEREGIRRSIEAMENADFVIALFDGSEPARGEDFELLRRMDGRNAVIAINKSDLPVRIDHESIAGRRRYIRLSTVTGEGLEELKSAVFESNLRNWSEEREGVVVTNLRHKLALDRAYAAVERAADLIRSNGPLEIFSLELREALDSVGEITGAVTTEEILDRIFSTFCIGK